MLLDPTFNSAHQLEAFRCGVREICNELDRELIVDTEAMPARMTPEGIVLQDVVFEIAPQGHPGSMPDEWRTQDDAAAGVNDKPKFII